jgi:hypothetical protein
MSGPKHNNLECLVLDAVEKCPLTDEARAIVAWKKSESFRRGFFAHRLQNPDDIDHFKRIIPRQAQRLLDQVTVLASGEAIVFGSAVHVPARVQIKIPKQQPWSATASPYADWTRSEKLPLAGILEAWGIGEPGGGEQSKSNGK